MSEQDGAGQSGQATQEQDQPNFALQRIYLKDFSFESPRAPQGFPSNWKPKIDLEINISNSALDDDNYEVVLSATITVKDESDQVNYLVELQQAGIFLMRGMDTESRHQMLGSFCPNLLFPYAREVIDSIVIKGSFPPLLLAPVNFEAIYQQAKAQAEVKNASVQ